jgi:hypothetical protein
MRIIARVQKQFDPRVAKIDDKIAAQKAAPTEGFVDLGSMILGDDEGEKTTRFVVAYEEPSGNEQADSRRCCRSSRPRSPRTSPRRRMAHRDLGTAYRRWG